MDDLDPFQALKLLGHKKCKRSQELRVFDKVNAGIDDFGAPAIHYLSDPITFSATEMLVGRRKTEERKTKRECAAEWIAKTLETGPMTAAALNDAALTVVDRDRQFSMDAFERARKDMRDAERLALERKPGTNPAEWWYWLTDRGVPDWHASDGEAEPTSAAPSCAHGPPHMRKMRKLTS